MEVFLILAVVLWWAWKSQPSLPQFDGSTVSDAPASDPEPDVPNPQSQSGVLQAIAAGIAKFEGANVSGSIPNRLNNPGDITYAAVDKTATGLLGSDSPGNGFSYAKFDNVQDGTDALLGWIQTHAQAHPDWSFTQFYRYYVTGNANANNPAVDAAAGSIAASAGIDPASLFADALGVS